MRYFILSLLIFLFLGCEQKVEHIVAKVNNDYLTLEEFKANFNESDWKKLSQKEKQDHLQEWVELTLFSQEADRNGISDTPEISSRIENVTKKIKSNALFSNKLSTMIATEEEMFDYYKIHQNKFQKDVKQYNIQRIFVKESSKLDFVRQEISDKSFTYAAKKHSEENLGRNGGIVGWIGKGDIDNIFWDTVQELNRLYYRTIHTSKGYYIVRFTDERIIKKNKNFLEVKNEIEKLVLQQKREEMYDNLLKELTHNAQIEISL